VDCIRFEKAIDIVRPDDFRIPVQRSELLGEAPCGVLRGEQPADLAIRVPKRLDDRVPPIEDGGPVALVSGEAPGRTSPLGRAAKGAWARSRGGFRGSRHMFSSKRAGDITPDGTMERSPGVFR
jgi:hypothetical protein